MAQDSAQREDTIEIVVVTTAGDLDRRFNESEPLRVVFEEALTLVGGHGHADQFRLEYNDEPLTDLGRSLEQLEEQFGWGNKVELELVPNPAVF